MMSLSNCTLHCRKTSTGESYWVSFEDKSFSKGTNFKVYSGLMNGKGCRSGDRCVVKVFRQSIGTESLCCCEVKKCHKAKELAKLFNGTIHTKNTRVRFAQLYWAQMDEISKIKQIFYSGKRKLSHKDYVLFEEDLRYSDYMAQGSEELILYMDCHGKNRKCVAKVLEAFAHFTYHQSNGELVICNLDGVQDEAGFCLKTPVIHSRKQEYGDNDRGTNGILEVFSNHICNNFCKDMIKPHQGMDNFPDNNRNYVSGRRSSKAPNSATRTMRPEQEQMVSQDAKSNSGRLLENLNSIDDHFMPQKQSVSSFRCVSSMSDHLEPTAPPVEDSNQSMFHPSPPSYNESLVANWLLQEQSRNCFTTCRHVEPLSLPTGPDALASQMSVDSARGRSTTSSTESKTADTNNNTETRGQSTGRDGDCRRNIRALCDTKHQNPCPFDSLLSPATDASFFPNIRDIFTQNSAKAFCNGSTSFQINSNFNNNPVSLCALNDSQTSPHSAFSSNSFGFLDARHVHDYALHYFNGNQPLPENPPSYKDSVREASR